jgi:hypothetical protein
MADPENRKLFVNMKLKILKQKFNWLVRNLQHELELIEVDLLYEISDEQKVYQLLIVLFPDLNKGVINEIKSKIIFRD